MMRGGEYLGLIVKVIDGPLPAPPCPLCQITCQTVINRTIWSRCGQGWSGRTVTSFRPISLRNIPVVRVVRAKTHISHMCERIYYYVLYSILSFFSLNFNFIKKYPDHPDHSRNHYGFAPTIRPDQP